MKLDDLQEYFELFIIKYLPYKDKEIYQRIVQFLLNYYLSHSYQDIPENFKLLFEEQIIPIDVYDSILLSNGFPDYIINRLGIKQKEILLRTFMDFNRYKGTLASIELISDNFDSFNIYELFVDFKDNNWVFLPQLVYQNENIPDRISNIPLDYDIIIAQTKYFLISQDTLDALRDSENLLLPIKTNLILIDYNTFTHYQSINQLYSAIILNHFQDHRINLYFQDGIYQTSFKKFHFLWHYIFYNFYHEPGNNKVIFPNLTGNFIVYNYSKEDFPFKLIELGGLNGSEGIHKKYLSLKLKHSPTTLAEFKKEYFDKFQDFLIDSEITENDMEVYAQRILPEELYNYVNIRLASKNKNELDTILDDLYNSVITWKHVIRSEISTLLTQKQHAPTAIIVDRYMSFIDNFISNLPVTTIKIQNSITYLLLYHFKPYHTELIFNETLSLMKVDDPFNSVYIDEIYPCNYNGQRVTLAHNSYNYYFTYRSVPHIDSLPITDDRVIKLNHIVNIYKLYDDSFISHYYGYKVSLAHNSYHYDFIYKSDVLTNSTIDHIYNFTYIPPIN